ncbi:MAG: HlyD family type I secretion periplasmic adaptor subunit [Acetobacteraceae bacterium]|nr:HlyD family type I secretion periplasmic adaptor subunit [Acetobacteraceae bacterium]
MGIATTGLGSIEAAGDAYPAPSLRRVALASALTVALGFGGLGTWAGLTRLDSAVPASGEFVAAGKRKTVSLLDSGILKELLVKEGDRVAAGQPLFLLDDVQTSAARDQAKAQYWGAVARTARLEAETQDRRTLDVPAVLIAEAGRDPAVASLLQAERALFASRWDTFDGSARITARKVQQLQTEAASLQTQVQALSTRLSLTEEEARGVDTLLRDGFAPRTQALEMHRAIAELQGALGDAAGRLEQTREAIEQTKLELTNLAETRRSDAAKDLQETKATIADAVQRLRAAESLLERSVVLAPEAGAVTDIKFFTPGSSITAGQPVLDIAPSDDRLLIEAEVVPTEIEHVHLGARVNVKLSAYKAHRVPSLEGRLVYVAADRQQDAHGDPVFLVRAELDRDALKPFPGVAVYAGMPADVLIIGRERTVLDFIISPIRDGMRHGMHED